MIDIIVLIIIASKEFLPSVHFYNSRSTILRILAGRHLTKPEGNLQSIYIIIPLFYRYEMKSGFQIRTFFFHIDGTTSSNLLLSKTH